MRLDNTSSSVELARFPLQPKEEGSSIIVTSKTAYSIGWPSRNTFCIGRGSILTLIEVSLSAV